MNYTCKRQASGPPLTHIIWPEHRQEVGVGCLVCKFDSLVQEGKLLDPLPFQGARYKHGGRKRISS